MGLRYAALGVAIVLAILAMAWPFRLPAAGRARALLSYFVSLCFGLIVILLAPLGHGNTVPFFGTMALVAWVLLGGLWMARRYPNLSNPDWMLKPWSPADWGLIAIIVLSSLATVLG